MKEKTFETEGMACGPPVTSESAPVSPLKLDYEEYREDLAEYDLTKEQENEFLEVLFNIMKTFAEIGYGLDSVQMFSPAIAEFSGQDSGNTLEQKDTTKTFNDAVKSNVARKEHNE